MTESVNVSALLDIALRARGWNDQPQSALATSRTSGSRAGAATLPRRTRGQLRTVPPTEAACAQPGSVSAMDATTADCAALAAEVSTLETSLRESEARNSSLEALVLSLMTEAEKQEERRARERRLRRASLSAPMAGESAEHVREMLEEGANALVAAHEHSLKLLEMRLSTMGEQLARCASALPAGRTSLRAGERSPRSPLPGASSAAFQAVYESEDEDWAQPTSGGLCIESLPLHVPTTGDHKGVTGGAFGIHGRRPAISTSPWSTNPARHTGVWWSEAATLKLGGEELGEASADDSAPPSPTVPNADDGATMTTEILPDGEPALSSAAQRTTSTALPGWESGNSAEVGDVFSSPPALLEEESASRSSASPWARVTNALTLTTRQNPRGKSVSRLSVAGQQALSGALQVAIARHPILATISADLRREVAASSMRELRVRAGAVVAATGADCDAFAIVGSGVFDGYIAESGPMPVREYVRGDSFGDLGLVCSCKHTITVRCREPGTLWLLERSGFHSSLLSTSQRRAASACKALKRVAALSVLSEVQLAVVASALQEVSLPPGAALLRRGEAWDALYIVCAGTLEDRFFQSNKKVRVRGLVQGRGRTIRAGEHLGEEALAQPRSVSTGSATGRRAGAGAGVASDSMSGVRACVDRGALPLRDSPCLASPSQPSSSETPQNMLPSISVCAGESGCRLLRLPATAVAQALGVTSLGADDPPSAGARAFHPAHRDIESRASALYARLAEAEPSIAAGFTSAGQREQLLSVVEVLRPPPGTELQRRGEPSEGILLLEAGTLLKGTPWGNAPSRRAPTNASSVEAVGVCGVGIVGVRRGACLTPERSSANPVNTATGDEEPMQPGMTIGALGSGPSPTSLFAHVGVVAYRLPRRAAMVILASTHELTKDKLTPRATPFHLRRPVPPPPPFASLSVAALLGEGGSSRVLLVRQQTTDRRATDRGLRVNVGGSCCDEFALKILHRATEQGVQPTRGQAGIPAVSTATSAIQAERERLALAACNHQFVPRLQAGINGVLMMEAVRGCELFFLLREVHRFEKSTAAFYTAMVLSALVHLHSLSIIHRDIKPENLVVDAEGYLRIVDLGLCRQLTHPAERAYTICGTPEYTAPEVLRGTGHGKEVDLWAVGVLLFEFLAGYPAFCADEPIKVFALILQGKPSVPKSFGGTARELLRELLREQPHARLGAMRGGAVEAACHPFFAAIDWVALLGRQVEAPLMPIIAKPSTEAAEIRKWQAELDAASTAATGPTANK